MLLLILYWHRRRRELIKYHSNENSYESAYDSLRQPYLMYWWKLYNFFDTIVVLMQSVTYYLRWNKAVNSLSFVRTLQVKWNWLTPRRSRLRFHCFGKLQLQKSVRGRDVELLIPKYEGLYDMRDFVREEKIKELMLGFNSNKRLSEMALQGEGNWESCEWFVKIK